MSAQSSPITFTSEEQLDLQRLEQNLELFNALKALLQQGIFPGNASVALVRCQQLSEQLISNTVQQVEQIKKTATDRSTAPKEEAKKEG
jgi:hypothetical protein